MCVSLWLNCICVHQWLRFDQLISYHPTFNFIISLCPSLPLSGCHAGSLYIHQFSTSCIHITCCKHMVHDAVCVAYDHNMYMYHIYTYTCTAILSWFAVNTQSALATMMTAHFPQLVPPFPSLSPLFTQLPFYFARGLMLYFHEKEC